MSAADLVARLAREGIDPSLLAEVAQELFVGEAERKSLADRRQHERDRKTRSRDSTGRRVNVADRPSVVPPIEDNLTPSGTTLPDEAIASSPARQPLTEAVEVWNENAAACGWPPIRSLSANRAKLLSARLREHGISGWRDAILKARSSPYLAGRDPPSWFTFPWLIKAENFLKLTEGNYDRRHAANSDPTFTALAEYQSLIGGGGSVG